MRWLLVPLVVLAGACGGGHGATGAAQPTTGAGAGAGGSGAGGESATATTGGGRLTQAECDKLLDHYIQVAMAELPADQRPTNQQIAAIRDKMRGDAQHSCVGQDRGPYQCAMKATTRRGVEACFSGPGGPGKGAGPGKAGGGAESVP